MKLNGYTPKSFSCLKEGYSLSQFTSDLFAGISVGVIALPLALAFAIASGVLPERGLFTAIVAGFVISLLGGSQLQIGGPTGAFVIIVYGVIQRHGYEGLVLATLIAGLLMILMGIVRLGILLKFISHSVIIGFTTGIAIIIFSSQIKDFFGLEMNHVPPDFLEKWQLFFSMAHTWNFWAFSLSFTTLAMLFLLKSFFPKLPGAIIAISLAMAVAYFFNFPVETIESKFGAIPRSLPSPSIPFFSLELLEKVFPDAVAIALLGAIESLLSAAVADKIAGTKHQSNCELVAQGLANISSAIFGGIPATGAIARTSANIRLGGKTPVAGMIHAITLALLMLCLAPLAGKIPLAALAGVLIFVAWNMSELSHFKTILKELNGNSLVLLATFLLTVLADLITAIQVGVILSWVVQPFSKVDQGSQAKT